MKIGAEAYQELLTGLLAEGQTVLTRLGGESMTPAIPDGTTARIVPPAGEPLRVGEVVMTRTPHGLLCHRVLRVTGQSVQTWGDVCRAPDAPVAAREVIGRVAAVRLAGEWQELRPRPRWRMRGRWIKHQLKRLLGIAANRGEAGACAAVPEQGE